jgi:RNA polymerase sigma-70 factor (ECF subfamily)
MRNEHDAEDAVQEAALRALRYFGTFDGGNGRAWFLQIVRNTCGAWCAQRPQTATDVFDEEIHTTDRSSDDPETLLLQTDASSVVERAIGTLPVRSRELLVMRELNGLSYRELAEAMRLPMGTVMSSLSRARQALRGALADELRQAGKSCTSEGTLR